MPSSSTQRRRLGLAAVAAQALGDVEDDVRPQVEQRFGQGLIGAAEGHPVPVLLHGPGQGLDRLAPVELGSGIGRRVRTPVDLDP